MKSNRTFSDFLAEFDQYDENPREELERLVNESGLSNTIRYTNLIEELDD